ncbi:MAG TPA: tetratricopeptide repeat protein [Vitreimonas sp.]|uniref:adenylate/guanylate cyclase domain-containing protein n=1 Tax=Vitreimonas sp. TaxID=3069702 RepID=UPI002D3C4017|nr:tetratricopeptide repeat protein [Vitreimonas sp.]HYD89034.1 tetratricopeptide repeat protein [Vitreimonas sp.]
MERKLAAILAADVVGYTALMERDEAGTFARLKRCQRELLEPEIAKRGGRIFKLMGDGFLAEFASVVDAVESAVAIQQALAGQNDGLAREQRLDLRVGLNLGEVIIDGTDRYGESVNIAARLQQLSDPGGICLSGKVASEMRRKTSFALEPMGEQRMRNIAEPVAVYRLKHDSAAQAPVAAAAAHPSIAVLPFLDMSPDRDQDYLCEGLAEELINALANVEGVRVTARSASFQFDAAGADLREIGRRLGVETLLEGSVRKAGDRLRITVRLVDVAAGDNRWSRRFDRATGDIFEIQDEIAGSVVASLRGAVLTHREKEALVRPQTRTEAYELYLRGRQHLARLTGPDLETARQMFTRALELDADYGPAWAGLAAVHATLYEWFGASDEDRASADTASRRGLEASPDIAEVHAARGFALSLLRRYDDAAKVFEEAIRLNPNLFEAYYYFARASFARGDIERANELFRRASEVRPEDFQSTSLRAMTLRMLRRTEEAREVVRESIRRAEYMLTLNPTDARALALGSTDLFEDGQLERAMEWSHRSLELYPDDMSVLVNAACLHAKAGFNEVALELLGRVFARGWGKRDWVEQDPDYDNLRGDPRFEALLAKLK